MCACVHVRIRACECHRSPTRRTPPHPWAFRQVVDFSKEVARLDKEIGQVQGMLDKLHKKMTAANYVERSPASVQAEDAAKVAAKEGELKALNEAKAAFAAGAD